MHPFMRGGYPPGGYGMPGAMPQNVNVNLRQDKRGEKMSEERVEVKNIFQGGEGGGRGGFGGDGGLATAAAIAALGGRNQGGFMGGYGGDGFGFGGGGLGALLAVALLGRGGFGDGFGHRGGFVRDGGDCCDQIGQQVILSKLGSIEGGVATAALQVQNSICEQTGELSGQIAALALGAQQGLANVKDTVQNLAAVELAAISGVKDAVQNGLALTNTNLLTGLCSVKEAGNANTDRILSALQTRWTAEDQAKIVAQANEITELRQENRRRADHDDLRIQITNTNTAVAAQQQAQGQFQVQRQGEEIAHLSRCVTALLGDIQAVKQGQVIFNSGTMAASGTQAAANTKVA